MFLGIDVQAQGTAERLARQEAVAESLERRLLQLEYRQAETDSRQREILARLETMTGVGVGLGLLLVLPQIIQLLGLVAGQKSLTAKP